MGQHGLSLGAIEAQRFSGEKPLRVILPIGLRVWASMGRAWGQSSGGSRSEKPLRVIFPIGLGSLGGVTGSPVREKSKVRAEVLRFSIVINFLTKVC